MAELRLEQVRKVYRSRGRAVEAVKGIDLAIQDGEFVALLGPSGCGKTSTLRMIAGLETITSGQIYIGDRLINGLEPSQRDVAMAFESYALYPPLTVRENIEFPLKARRVPPDERRRRVERVAEMLQLGPILDLKPAQLSGGEQQRVSLARALVRNASVLLLDEPMSHLDPRLRFQMRLHLKELLQEISTTTIIVTHDQLEAIALADRIAVMHQGVVEQFGDRNALYNQPATIFVADFVGEPPTNFVRCALTSADGEPAFRSQDGAVCLPPPHRLRASLRDRLGQEFVLGIRPQDMAIATPGERDPYRLPGRITFVEWIGEETHVTVEAGQATLIVVTGAEDYFEEGQQVDVTFPEEALHVFDPESGRAL